MNGKHGIFIAKTLSVLAGFAVLLLAVMFTIGGCDNDTTSSTGPTVGGGGSAKIVGQWKLPEYSTAAIEFKSDGTAIVGDNFASYTYNGTTLNLKGEFGNHTETAILSNNGDTLTISGFPDGSGLN